MSATLSDAQVRHLLACVRNLGRAMTSMNAARLPTLPGTAAPEWYFALDEAETAIRTASNRLIDGMEDIDRIRAETIARVEAAAGGSVRDVARTGGISTSTVQTWTKEKT